MGARIFKRNPDTGQNEELDEIKSGLCFNWSSTTSTPVGFSEIRFNDADYSLSTNIYIDNFSLSQIDIKEILLDAQSGGTIMVSGDNHEWNKTLFRITGDPVANSSDVTIPVSFISEQDTIAFTHSNGDPISIQLSPAPSPGASSEFTDDLFRIQDNTDNTKELAFEVDSIATATTRTITVPDSNVDLGDIDTNNAKVSNATHTGDATGATALTLATVNSDVGSFTKPTLTINAKGLVTAATSEIIGGLVVTSTSTTNVANGSYNVLEDTTALTSVNSGIAQDSDWTLEITQAGITNQKGRVSAVVKCEKTGGAGRQYDFAIFKNGSIISDSEMTDLMLENNDTWSNIKCTAPVEMSTGDLFSLRVSGNGTGDDIECTNGTIYIE